MLCSRLRFGWISILFIAAPLLTAAQSGSSSSRRSHPVPHVQAAPDLGALTDHLYLNRLFGFSYKVPFGWVDRTEQMRQDSAAAEGSTGGDDRTSGSRAKSLLLLSVFERPPEAAGDTINSAVVIAAESVSTYPGLKDASQYFGPLTELTTSKGFKVVNEPYDAEVGGKQLVRADFSKQVGKLTMFQSTLAAIEKGYIVSLTFIGGSEDEVEELMGSLQWAHERPRR
jgi:hypothetical protein